MGEGTGAGNSRSRLSQERLAEILDVAAEVFLSEGFSSASTNEIARKANTSKGTFYSRFPTKEALFMAVLESRMMGQFTEAIGSMPFEPPLRESLEAFCGRYLRHAVTNDQVRLLRLVSKEAERFPQLPQSFFDAGPNRVRDALIDYLNAQIAMGRLLDNGAERMAEQFMDLLRGGQVLLYVLGVRSKALSAAEKKRHSKDTVDLFLRGYGIG